MPAEWAPHAATWIAWPHNAEDWPGKFQPIPWVYAEIVRHLSQRRRRPHPRQRRRRRKPRHRPSSAAPEPTSPASTSTTGRPTASGSATPAPSSSKNPARRPRPHQLEVQRLGQVRQLAPRRPDPPARSQTLRHPRVQTRGRTPRPANPTASSSKAAASTPTAPASSSPPKSASSPKSSSATPASATKPKPATTSNKPSTTTSASNRVLWLHRGCAGDDTHGHVDDITRFVAENKILTCVEPNTHDENHLPLAENLDRLRSFRNLDGKPFEIVELPMPSPVVFEGQRLPASYANFYIANYARPRPHLQRPQRPPRPQHHRQLLPRPRHHRHPRRRPRLGPRHPPLPDPAGTRIAQ